jgi:L-arabinose transport system substrate-binding protein
MKKLFLILLMLVAVGTFGYAARPKEDPAQKAAAPKKIVLAYVCKILDNPWFQATTAAFKKKALELGASEVLLIDSKMDPELSMSQVDTVIAQKIDGLVISLPDQKLSRAVVDKCKAANIPVIGTDDPLIENGKRIAPSFELNSYDAGYVMGEFLGNYVNKNKLVGNIKVTMYVNLAALQISSFVERTNGANAGWLKMVPVYPKDRMITADTDTADPEAGYQTMAATIVAHPEVKTWFVTTVNDEVATGAVRALEQARLDKTSYVVGLGGYLAKNEFKKDVTCLVASSYISPQIDGETNAQAMMDFILHGKEIYGQYKKAGMDYGVFFLPSIVVTKENYRQVMGKDAD